MFTDVPLIEVFSIEGRYLTAPKGHAVIVFSALKMDTFSLSLYLTYRVTSVLLNYFLQSSPPNGKRVFHTLTRYKLDHYLLKFYKYTWYPESYVPH